MLVPLFGVHYTVFLGLSYSIGVDQRVELIWLFGDQLFASFQVCTVFDWINNHYRKLNVPRELIAVSALESDLYNFH